MANTVEILVELRDLASKGVKELNQTFAGLGKTAISVNNGLDLIPSTLDLIPIGLQGIKNAADTVISSVFNLQNALIGLGVGKFAQEVVETGAAFEKFGASLKTILGSSEAADKALSWIADFTETTPFELEEVSEAFTSLSAYGLDATKNLAVLGDTAAAMGKPLSQAVEAMADAVTGEFERLKEFGIRTKTEGDNVTFSWLQNGEQMQKSVQKTGAAIESGLTDILENRFQGAMSGFSNTWQGMMSNLLDTWTLFQKSVADAGIFDYLKDQLAAALAQIEIWKKQGVLDDWAKRISAALQSVVENLKSFGLFLFGLADAFEPFIKRLLVVIPTILNITSYLKLFSIAIGVLIIAITTISALLVQKFVVGVVLAIAKTVLLNSTIAAMAPTLALVTKGLFALKTAAALAAAAFVGWQIGRLIGEMKLFNNGTQSVNEAVQNMFDVMDGATQKQIDAIDPLLGKLRQFSEFRLPANFADAGILAQEEFNKSLQKGELYWKTFIRQQQISLKLAEESGGKTSSAYKSIAAGIDLAKERLKLLGDEQTKLKENLTNEQTEIQKAITATTEAQAKATQANLDERKAALEAEKAIYLEGNQTFSEYEKAKQGIVSESEKQLNEIRLSFAGQTEELGAQALIALQEQRSLDLIGLQIALNQKLISEKEYNEKKAQTIEESGKREEKINAETGNAIINERKRQADEYVKIYKSETDRVKNEADRRVAEVALAEAKGEITAVESVNRKLEIEEEYLQSRLEKLTEYTDAFAKAGDEESKEFQQLNDDKKAVESELLEFRTEKITALKGIQEKTEKERVDAIKAANDEIRALSAADTELRAAQLQVAFSEIDELEKNGVLSLLEATAEKKEIEADFAIFKAEKAKEAVELSIEEYGIDSAEYISATAAKITAELELEAAIEAADAAFQAMAETAAESNEGFEESQEEMRFEMTRTIDQMRELRKVSQVPVLVDIDVERANSSLGELILAIEDARLNMSQFAGISSSVVNTNSALFASLNETKDQFDELGKKARDAGIEIDLMDLSLEEATKVVNEQIASWQDFNASMERTGQNVLQLDSDVQTFIQNMTGTDIQQANESLLDLLLAIDETKENMQNLTGASSDQIEMYNRLLSSLESTEAEYEALAQKAKEAGIEIDFMDMSLEEAAENIEDRIIEWNNFNAAINELKVSVSELDTEMELFFSGAAGTRKEFELTGESMQVLKDQLSAFNEELSSGSIDAAKDMAKGIQESYDVIYNDAKDTLDNLTEKWQDYFDRIESIYEQIEALTLSTEDKIRNLRRDLLSEEEAWQDTRLEYEEKYQAAVEAMQEGQNERAAELFQEAIGIAEELATEVTDASGEVLSSLEDNTSTAIDLINKAKEAATDALNEYSGKLKRNQDDLSDSINDSYDNFKRFKDFVDSADGDFNIDFTGSGSATRPLSEKIVEMGKAIGAFASDVANQSPSINTDFAGLNPPQTGGLAGASAISPIMPELGVKDLGKINVQLNGKEYPVMGEVDTLKQLESALKWQGLAEVVS